VIHWVDSNPEQRKREYKMRAVFWVACIWALLGQQAGFSQPIVVPNENVLLSPVGDEHLLNVSRSPSFDADNCQELFCSFVVFEYENGVLDFGADHQFLTVSGDWYLVSAGDIFSEATTDQYPAMFLQGHLVGPPVDVGTSDFYLGVGLDTSTYGWVQLRPIDGGLTMVANVIAYGSRGIVVGTTQVVPEPTSRPLLLIGLAALIYKLCITRQ
jgi:hypothetical protein